MPGFDLRTNCPINSWMSEFNLHLSPLTFTLAFPFIIGDILTAKFNKICVTESELDCEHRWRDDVRCWSVQRRKLLLKPSARTEFLLFKTKIPSGQKTISPWIWISPVLLYSSTTAWLLPRTSQTNAQIHQVWFSKCHCLWIRAPAVPSIHGRAAVRADQHLPGSACSSWREAVTCSGYPSKERFSFNLCFSVSALQLSARSRACSGILLTAATAVVWAAEMKSLLRFGPVVLRLLTPWQIPKECGLCHLPSSH